MTGYLSKNLIKAEVYAIRREEGGFVNFIKGEEIYLFIKLLRILKEGLY